MKISSWVICEHPQLTTFLNNSPGVVFGYGPLQLVWVLGMGVRNLVALEPDIAHEVPVTTLGGLLAVPPQASIKAISLIPVGDMEVDIVDGGGH